MLRKIERDERRPSEQLAALLVEHLAVSAAQQQPFLRLARGLYVPEMPAPQNTPVLVSAEPLDTDAQEDHERSLFVAREGDLESLQEHLRGAVAGQGQTLFVAGEAGRGKTTLLREFAIQAQDKWPQLLVAGGSSDIYAGLGDPLLPFRDMFRLLVGDIDHVRSTAVFNREHALRLRRALPVTMQAILAHGPTLIGSLVSHSMLEARIKRDYPDPTGAPTLLGRLQELQARQFVAGQVDLPQDCLFAELSTTLQAIAQQYPLLLILDDIHWADPSSLSLLAHLMARLQDHGILIVCSFRPEDLALTRATSPGGEALSHPLLDVLSESRRRFGDNRIDLDRSSAETVKEFIDAMLDAEPNALEDDFRRHLAYLTEGHPLFVVELLRDMKERGDLRQDAHGRWVTSKPLNWEHIPARVEGVIEKRIMRLPTDLRELLNIASVEGESFTVEVIASVKQLDARLLTRRLSAELDRQHQLVYGQGILSVDGNRLSQFRFQHNLFQKYLYERLSYAERMYLHEDVGRALEALYSGQVEPEEVPAAQLARHFREARMNEAASRYSLQAARHAMRLLAYSEAAAHCERGLALLEELGPGAGVENLSFELTLALATAYWRDGRVAEAMAMYVRSVEIARLLDDPLPLARAAIAYEEPRWRFNLPAEPSQAYIRDALAALGEEDSALRVQLLVNLTKASQAPGAEAGLRLLLDQALQVARRINDPVALFDVLRISVNIDRRPEATAARLDDLEELVAIAMELGELGRQGDAYGLLIYDHLELGHIDLVDAAMAQQKRVAEESLQPFQMHMSLALHTMRAILKGSFADAERLAGEAAGLSQQMGMAALDGLYGMHMFTIRREQGRMSEVLPVVKAVFSSNPAASIWRPGLALIYCSLNLRQECTAVFEDLAQDDFATVPRDAMWVGSLTYLAEVCAYLGDKARAAQLYQWLLPYDGRTAVAGAATVCTGAVARYLGMLAAVQCDWPAAQGHFEAALTLDEALGAWPWLAHSQVEFAGMLLALGHEGGRTRAAALLTQAETTADRLGMELLLTQCRRQQAAIAFA